MKNLHYTKANQTKIQVISKEKYNRNDIDIILKVTQYSTNSGDCWYSASSLIEGRISSKRFNSKEDAHAFLSHFVF